MRPDARPRRFFFYGTLVGASDTPIARWLAPRLSGVERASVPGRLLAVPAARGWYPILVAGAGGERAWGVVCAAALAPGDLARLDGYEGRDYRRASALARLARGGGRAAQLYRWRAPTPPNAEPVRGGDFIAWLGETGRAPFAVARHGR